VLATVQTYGRQAAHAKESALRAVTLLIRLRAAHSDVTEYGLRLGQGYDIIGLSLVETGQYAVGKPYHVQAIEVLSETSRQAPNDAKVKSSWGLAYVHLCGACQYMGQRDAQQEALRHAITIYQQIVDENPTNARFRKELAQAWGGLGILRYDMGRPSSAAESFESAALLLEKLA
jgi:tetratricopeptide (TPR) repeat protein